MIAEKVKSTNIGVGVGIVLEIGGRVLMALGASHGGNLAMIVPGIVITLVGIVVFIWGCMNYSEGKGYSKWLGLVGLLSCLGLLVLIVMPDKCKSGSLPVSGAPSFPPSDNVWPPPPAT